MFNNPATVPRFNCPNCGTLYAIVQVEPDDASDDRDVACMTCGAPLPAREGRFVLKYFRLRRVGTSDRDKYTVV